MGFPLRKPVRSLFKISVTICLISNLFVDMHRLRRLLKIWSRLSKMQNQGLICLITLIAPLAIFPLFFQIAVPTKPRPNVLTEPTVLKHLLHNPILLSPTIIRLHFGFQHLFSAVSAFIFCILRRY